MTLMLADDPIGKQLRETIEQHSEERRRTFVTGFVRFVIKRGSGALAPMKEGGKAETWQAVGRQLYGSELFNETLERELVIRKEQGHAESRVPSIRSDQGSDARAGETTGGGENLGGKDHEQPRRKGATPPSAST